VRLAAKEGLSGVTLEAVASETGLSKAGVLYYFDGKDGLLVGTMEWLTAEYLRALEAAMAKDPRVPGRFARAMLNTLCSDEHNRAYRSLLAGLPQLSRLAEPHQALYRRLHQFMLEDGLDPVDAALVFLASDGLWFGQVLGFPALPVGLERRVLKRLHAMTRGSR
jgi:AcrR family transcriptional regulator